MGHSMMLAALIKSKEDLIKAIKSTFPDGIFVCLPPKFMQPLSKSHFIHPPSRNLQEIYHENFVILVDANLPISRLRRFSFPLWFEYRLW